MSGQAGPSILVEMHEQISFQLRIRTLPKLFEELVNTIILFFVVPPQDSFLSISNHTFYCSIFTEHNITIHVLARHSWKSSCLNVLNVNLL